MRRRRPQIVGIFEHPSRLIPGRSLESVYLEILAGVVSDAGLAPDSIDGLITSTVAGGSAAMAESLGLTALTYAESTDLGGASYVSHAGRAARLIESRRCRAVLVIMAGLPRQGVSASMPPAPNATAERASGATLIAYYAMLAKRHAYQFGTEPEDLAQIKVAATYHASFNEQAFLRNRMSVEEVLDSPLIASPLRRADCCVDTDGGGAFLMVAPEIARDLGTSGPVVLSQEDAFLGSDNGRYELTTTPAARTGPRALAAAGLNAADIDYASIYDSFTITVLTAMEGIGFFEPGGGRDILRDGGLLAPDGRIPVNTDGGGLANNHPDRRGGMIRMIEAVRQLRGEAHPRLQIPHAEFALVHGSGHSLGSRAAVSTAILQRGDAA